MKKDFLKETSIHHVTCYLFLLYICHFSVARGDTESIVWLSSLDLTKTTAGWGSPQADKSVDGRPLSIGGVSYEKGVGTHAHSVMHIALHGDSRRFVSFVGVDDEIQGASEASVIFKIYADNKLVFNSGIMKAGNAAKKADIQLKGIEKLVLVVNDAGNGINADHADWAMARFEISGPPRLAVDPPTEKEYILTPVPGPTPHINGPKVFGTRPGNPFLYRVPVTGERPMAFSAENLPDSMNLDTGTGIVTGNSPEKRGEYRIIFKVKNTYGSDSRLLKLVVGDTLALTPPMGWNSWYIHYGRVTDANIRAAADAMINSGMADYGYMYVNIDDYWSKEPGDRPERDQCENILPNYKFPDMYKLTDYIHGKGLRAGIYTSPGPQTCGRCAASYQYEQNDAQRFAEWGFDFLKYDWCSYGSHDGNQNLYDLIKPYALMGEILKNVDRDVVYNLCQYGMGNVWEWGAEVGGNCWRTTGDLGPMQGGFLEVGLINARYYAYAKPGRWNDPDYILIGWVGDPHTQGIGQKVSMTPSRQYQYMSMWSLMAAPLIYSGDMTKLDDFTWNVLCNSEVIDINQDALGQQGRIIEKTDEYFIMVKDLADESKAVGLFNTAEVPLFLKIKWKTLGMQEKQTVRDVWRQKNLGEYSKTFETQIPRYGVSLIRVIP